MASKEGKKEKGCVKTDAAFLLTIGSFLLTMELFCLHISLAIDNFSCFTCSWSFFAYNFSFFTYNWSLFAYSGKVRLIRALRDCKQRSLTVSKTAPTVSKQNFPVKTGQLCRCHEVLMSEITVRVKIITGSLVTIEHCDWPPYTGVSTPPSPEIPKKSQKGVPGPPGPECQKSVEKVPNDPKKSQKDYKISVRGLFRHFFDTPGGEAREVLFETFWGFRGSGVWRLLYMGIANMTVCSHRNKLFPERPVPDLVGLPLGTKTFFAKDLGKVILDRLLSMNSSRSSLPYTGNTWNYLK